MHHASSNEPTEKEIRKAIPFTTASKIKNIGINLRKISSQKQSCSRKGDQKGHQKMETYCLFLERQNQ